MAEKYSTKLYVVHVMPPVVNPILTESDPILFTEPDKFLILNLEDRMQQEYGNRIEDNFDYELIVMDGHVSSEILKFLKENRSCCYGIFWHDWNGACVIRQCCQTSCA